MDTASSKPRFPTHGYVGIAIILLAEGLLFGGNQLVGHWFTPIVWTGYILFIDALVYRLKGRSLLMTARVEFVIIALVSIAGWWLFEFYNAPRFWKSELELWWHYHNLEPNLFLRRAGYDWAFATISPALFETSELFMAWYTACGSERVRRGTVSKPKNRSVRIKFSKSTMGSIILVGAVGAIAPLLFPSAWFAPVVWLSLILLLDPLNALRGWPSLTGDLARGDWRRLWFLLASGLVCGVLWEFWNYWALSKWTYTVPYLGNVKIFEMPALGFLGFPPFAIECWAMYIFCRSLLGGEPKSSDAIWIETNV